MTHAELSAMSSCSTLSPSTSGVQMASLAINVPPSQSPAEMSDSGDEHAKSLTSACIIGAQQRVLLVAPAVKIYASDTAACPIGGGLPALCWLQLRGVLHSNCADLL